MSKFYRINQNIPATELRVLDAQGEQISIMTKQEALDKAKELELDLVEIAPQAQPPVAKIIDFQKFRYQEGKKERAARKGSSEGGLKELWLSPRIEEHDLMVRLNRAAEFLNEGYKVKLTVRFKGREMVHPENGQRVLQKAFDHFADKILVEREPKFEGRNYSAIIARSRGGQHAETKNEQNTL